MTWRNLLLRAYPRTWRAEYGEELAAILAPRRFTLGLILDVLAGAGKQHLNRVEPWMVCGLGLALWYVMARLAAVFVHSRTFTLWYFSGGLFIMLAGGAWTVSQRKVGLRKATAASAKAALIGQTGMVVLMLQVLPRVSAYSFQGHGIYFWFCRSLAINFALAMMCGFVGALLARGIARMRSLTPQSH